MKKILVLPVLIFSLMLLPRPTYAWGDGIPGALLKQSMEQISRGIEGTILGAVKAAAVTSISSQVDRLLGGAGVGQPRFIRNYDDYLRLQPQLEAETAVYNFLAKTYRSLGSTTNYSSTAGGSSLQGNYETKLGDNIKNTVLNKDTYAYDLNEYCANPETSLREGDLRCLDAWKNNPANNPYGAALRAEYEYQRVRDEIRFQRQVEATSTGFRGAVDPKTGNIVTPSGTVAAVYNDAKTLASKIITASNNPAELASGVVFALVNRTINTIASKAAGAVENVVDRTVGKAVTEIGRISGDVGNVLYTADGYILTADGYITEAGYQAEQYNQLQQQANSSTAAPPNPLPPLY
jgi:hypothetical protein